MLQLKVSKVGSETGLILDEEVLGRLQVHEGDTLYVLDAPRGTIRLSRFTPEEVRQLELAEQIMTDDWEVLRALSK